MSAAGTRFTRFVVVMIMAVVMTVFMLVAAEKGSDLHDVNVVRGT
jgi:hypothetical protein